MVSLGCAGIVVNEEQDFSVFWPYLAIQLHKTPSKVAEVIHELEFAVYLVGSFFFYISEAVGFVVLASHLWRQFLCAISIAT